MSVAQGVSPGGSIGRPTPPVPSLPATARGERVTASFPGLTPCATHISPRWGSFQDFREHRNVVLMNVTLSN